MEKKTERVEIFATVGEFDSEPGQVVPVDNSRLDRIKQADPDEHKAKFATITIEEGTSKNKRRWPGKVLEKIAEQVRSKEPVGYRGHPLLRKDFDKGADFPDPQTVWVGATTINRNGKTTLMVKGYNLKDKPIRGELLSGAVDSVSICGDATMVPTGKGGYDVEDFEIQTIDWSRKGGEGMVGKVLALTGEQEGEIDDNDEGSEGIVKPEDIAALTETDLRRYNPDLASAIEEQGKKDSELAKQVGEQEKELEAVKPAAEEAKTVREKLGLAEGESVIDAISKLISDAKAGLREEFQSHVKATLEKKLKGDENKPVRDLVAALVGEMDESVDSKEAAEKAAEDKVNEILDRNESVKKLVGEMGEEDDEGQRQRRPAPSVRQHETGTRSKSSENLDVEEVPV